VDAHHGATERRSADLREPGGGKDVSVSNVQLSPGHVLARLRGHRIALQYTGSALAGEVDGGPCERRADAAAAEVAAYGEARHRPDAVVGLVLGSVLPRAGSEPDVSGAGFDSAPAHGLALEVRNKAACMVGPWIAALRLLPEPACAFGDRDSFRVPFAPPKLEALAPAARVSVAARSEHSREVTPARLVGGKDCDLRCSHRLWHG